MPEYRGEARREFLMKDVFDALTVSCKDLDISFRMALSAKLLAEDLSVKLELAEALEHMIKAEEGLLSVMQEINNEV